MKNSKILFLIAFVTISAIFCSCSKYENGPGISLRSQTARVVNHWKVEKAMWDGEDVTEDLEELEFEFKKDMSFNYYDEGTLDDKGQWAFADDKEAIELTYDSDPSEKEKMKITKLKEKEMVAELTGFGVFEITFVPK